MLDLVRSVPRIVPLALRSLRPHLHSAVIRTLGGASTA
jgi:hypothetical protein